MKLLPTFLYLLQHWGNVVASLGSGDRGVLSEVAKRGSSLDAGDQPYQGVDIEQQVDINEWFRRYSIDGWWLIMVVYDG